LRKRQADGHPHGHQISLCLSEDSGQIVPTTRLSQAGEKEGASPRCLTRSWPKRPLYEAYCGRRGLGIAPSDLGPAVSEPAGRETPRGRNTHPLATTRSERANQVFGTEATWGGFGPSGGSQGWGRTRNPQESIEVIPATHRYPQRRRDSVYGDGQRHERQAESAAKLIFASPVENFARVPQAARQAGR
jgi:hypothetical protein